MDYRDAPHLLGLLTSAAVRYHVMSSDLSDPLYWMCVILAPVAQAPFPLFLTLFRCHVVEVRGLVGSLMECRDNL